MTTLARLRGEVDAMVDELHGLVAHESPTGDVTRLDALAEVLASQWRAAGATVHHHRVDGVGAHLELRWDGPAGTPADVAPVLLVGHYDTVHDVGTLDRNPWRIDDEGRAWGPGTQDMKAGLVIARRALAHLQTTGTPARRPVVALLTADEEVGSPTSAELIRAWARRSAAALVFEASAAGALKTRRKGVGLWTVTAHGRAAHAGQRFADGRNAIVALADVVGRVAELTDLDAGTTVNVGVLRGGTRANVVAERAHAVVDVRFTDPAEADRVAQALAGLAGERDGVVLRIDGGINRPAMQRSPASAALFAQARACARGLGLDLAEAAAGGASDGNLTAAEGTPTLDGLGAVGDGLHTDHEWVALDCLPERAALLADLLATLDV